MIMCTIKQKKAILEAVHYFFDYYNIYNVVSDVISRILQQLINSNKFLSC